MKAEKRHEVQALMGEAHKAAGNVAVSALTREVKRLMRGRAGEPAEARAKRVEKALSLVEAVNVLMVEAENAVAAHAAEKAVVLLQEAVEAGEPESKHNGESNPVEEFFGGMLAMPKA